MSDYKCTGWTFTSEPVPEIFYNEGDGFTISVDFSQGLMAGFIKRLGNTIVVNPGLSPFGFDVYNKSSSVVGDSTGSSVSFNVHAPYTSGYSFGSSGWWDGYTAPTKPTDSGSDSVTLKAVVFAEAASGTDSVSVQISYAPDIGPFNPTLTQTFAFTMNRRAASTNPSDYLWQWHTTSAYSDATPATGTGFTYNSMPGDTKTMYLRGRRLATDAWTNVGAVTFVDDRPIS